MNDGTPSLLNEELVGPGNSPSITHWNDYFLVVYENVNRLWQRRGSYSSENSSLFDRTELMNNILSWGGFQNPNVVATPTGEILLVFKAMDNNNSGLFASHGKFLNGSGNDRGKVNWLMKTNPNNVWAWRRPSRYNNTATPEFITGTTSTIDKPVLSTPKLLENSGGLKKWEIVYTISDGSNNSRYVTATFKTHRLGNNFSTEDKNELDLTDIVDEEFTQPTFTPNRVRPIRFDNDHFVFIYDELEGNKSAYVVAKDAHNSGTFTDEYPINVKENLEWFAGAIYDIEGTSYIFTVTTSENNSYNLGYNFLGPYQNNEGDLNQN